MKVGALIDRLRHYPRDAEVVLARVFDGEVDGKVYDVDRIRMKEIVVEPPAAIATDDDFDADRETVTAVVIYPEA
jgi:hypothetical protein